MKRYTGSHKRWLTRIPAGILAAILSFPLSVIFQGCFTGIESTPRITYKDVSRQKAGETPEQVFARQFRVVPLGEWQPGRCFLLADARGSLSYSAPAGKTTRVAAGDTLIYRGLREVPAITGGMAAELVFTLSGHPADTLLYRPGGDAAALAGRGNVQMPFLVDLSLVEAASRTLVGKELVTRTDRWLSPDGNDIKGRKFLKVKVTEVNAYDENYPFLVAFSSLEKDDEKGALLMSTTVGDGVPALRGFDSLFLMADPRDNYPQITDVNWELIRQGKVAEGMTTQEASLSLGSPRDVDRRHDQSLLYERWRYPDGVYLIFENGLLVRYNQ